jgi:hypothetical protein
MFIVLFAISLLAWLGGFLVFHVSSALIHISVAVRGDFVNCASISAEDRIVKYESGAALRTA